MMPPPDTASWPLTAVHDRPTRCPAKLVNKLVEACEPICRTRSMRNLRAEAAIAPYAKSGSAAVG